MMQKLWQKKLELSYSRDVIDIVQFGSSVMESLNENEKPNDIDIAVIFQKIPLKEQLIQAQGIKKQIEKISEIPVHINSFDFYTLFEESNFAKENILFYGKSIIKKSYFAEKFGFSPKIQISYLLKDLKKKDKIKFHYMLKGKKGEYGLLKKYGGELLKPGLIEIFPEYEPIFTSLMKRITNKIQIKKILLS